MFPTLGATAHYDRLSELRRDRAYMEELVNADTSRFFVLAGGKPIINSNEDRTEASIKWFERDVLQDLGLPFADAILLGSDPDTGHARFALPLTEHLARHAPGADEHFEHIVELRSLASQGVISSDELSLIGQAVALANWHEETRCCGRCGGSMSNRDGGWKRRCWACKNEIFPRVDPVVIMAITDGKRLVLGHEERFPEKMYSTLAGFVEPGDDIAHAVRRETEEEVGLKVGDVRFVGGQPWPFPHSLMIGCIAMAPPEELKINTSEIADARWFTRDDVEAMVSKTHAEGLWTPGKQSMAHALIETFLKEFND